MILNCHSHTPLLVEAPSAGSRTSISGLVCYDLTEDDLVDDNCNSEFGSWVGLSQNKICFISLSTYSKYSACMDNRTTHTILGQTICIAFLWVRIAYLARMRTVLLE